MLYYWMSDRVMRIPELYKSHFLKRQLQVQGAYKRCSYQTFSSQAWFEVPFFKSLTLCIAEPLLKISLPTIGIILELYLHIPGDVCYRRLILNGNFDHETINSWIHKIFRNLNISLDVCKKWTGTPMELLKNSDFPRGFQ